MRPNRVTLKYPDFKKDDNVDVHVRVFNFAMKANAKTFEEYIINAISYTLRDTTSNWYHNYMLEFLDYIFSELCEELLHTFTTKVCTHIKPGSKWNYYVVVV